MGEKLSINNSKTPALGKRKPGNSFSDTDKNWQKLSNEVTDYAKKKFTKKPLKPSG